MPRRIKKKPVERIPGKKPREPLRIKEVGQKKSHPVAPVRRIGGPIKDVSRPSTITLGVMLRNMIFGKHVKKPGKKKHVKA